MTVIIAAVPRSGSSLVAGIFEAHGLWIGRDGIKGADWTKNPYRDYENKDIDQWFRNGKEPLQQYLESITPQDKRLVYKCRPDKAKKMKAKLNGQCQIVRCFRRFDSIVASDVENKGKKEISRNQQVIDLCNLPGPPIDVDAVMARDFGTLANAFDHCGQTFVATLAEAQIDDSLWHHL
ncbi:hypothetical protein N9937_01075 [bacterium]|nr:hypothetical protein [bacterium]